MSSVNGDKARFNRLRKQKIQRRKRQHKMFGALPKQSNSASPRAGAKT